MALATIPIGQRVRARPLSPPPGWTLSQRKRARKGLGASATLMIVSLVLLLSARRVSATVAATAAATTATVANKVSAMDEDIEPKEKCV